MSPKVSVTLPAELLEALDEAARSLDSSRSEVVRQALLGHLASLMRREEAPSKEEKPAYFRPEQTLTIAEELERPERPGLQDEPDED
ncbi:MAG: ribbon-helix-helix domain-containing protein [Anaerolineae bacterium]